MIDNTIVGNHIASLRKEKGLTQNELGSRLNVSFQAVSKWERGETLPDVSILVDLANVLETTIDNILLGGEKMVEYKGKISVCDIVEGINCLERFGQLIGKDNILYRSTIDGIDKSLNMEIDNYLQDDFKREAIVAEAVVQNLIAGYYVDLSDVRNNFKHKHFADVVCDYARKYGIK